MSPTALFRPHRPVTVGALAGALACMLAIAPAASVAATTAGSATATEAGGGVHATSAGDSAARRRAEEPGAAALARARSTGRSGRAEARRGALGVSPSSVGDESSSPTSSPLSERVRASTAAAAARARAAGLAARREAQARAAAAREEAIAAGAKARAEAGAGADEATSSGGGSGAGSEHGATVSVQSDPGRVSLLPGRRDVLINHRALVRGYVPTRQAGTTVVLEVKRADGTWGEVDRTRTIDGGKFYLEWYPKRPGHYRVRVRPVSSASGDPSPTRLLYIYRTAMASWYGPGFYGNKTACGQTFTNKLLGVANRTLPCGTRVTIRYGDRAITVPVVDRGPYVDGRDYDLTEATKNYLGFEGVDRVWATA